MGTETIHLDFQGYFYLPLLAKCHANYIMTIFLPGIMSNYKSHIQQLVYEVFYAYVMCFHIGYFQAQLRDLQQVAEDLQIRLDGYRRRTQGADRLKELPAGNNGKFYSTSNTLSFG